MPVRHHLRVIVRILTARVPRENVGPFNDLLRAQLGELRLQPGLVYAKLARRLNEDHGEEVVLVEEWRTPSDLFEWTHGRLTKPRLLPGTEDLIHDLTISHYEALDLAPDDLLGRVLGTNGVEARAVSAEVDQRRAQIEQPRPIEGPRPVEELRPEVERQRPEIERSADSVPVIPRAIRDDATATTRRYAPPVGAGRDGGARWPNRTNPAMDAHG